MFRASIICAFVANFLASAAVVAAEEHPPLSFAKDVQPILSGKCFACHGFDPDHREADLRLDKFEPADSSGMSSVVDLTDPANSYLLERVRTSDPEELMPPPHAGEPLTTEEVKLLEHWIAQGATYEEHWAFTAPKRPDVPRVNNPAWVKTPIDAFILARLEAEGLTPSKRADSKTLLRRLYLDLAGLPPTVDEARRFANSPPQSALRDEIERLLQSRHYGERWGRIWLDAARYADSDGFEKDKPRRVWMYRDWVIDSLNDDLPYDQFIIEQIAGDMVPSPTQSQQVATGFLRNSMINEEGGIDPEQFRMEALYDRMDAVGKSVLGLTLQCAQCHTHKYDPLTHTEYYAMFAFLNNCYEGSLAVYSDTDDTERKKVLSKIASLEMKLRDSNPDWQRRMAAWEEEVQRKPSTEWTIVKPNLDASGGQKHYLLDDGSVLAAGYAPGRHTTHFTAKIKASEIRSVRLEVMNHSDLPLGGPGRSPLGLFGLSEIHIRTAPLGGSAKLTTQKVARSTSDVTPEKKPLAPTFNIDHRKGYVTGPIAFAHDGKKQTAWTTDIGPGRSNVPRQAVLVLEKPQKNAEGFLISFDLVQDHGSKNNNEMWNNNLGRFRLAVSADENAEADPVPREVRHILDISTGDRTPAEQAQVFSYWRTTQDEWKGTNDQIEALWQQHPVGTSQLVLKEREDRRTTHRLDRGDFLSPREEVSPGVPEFLHMLDDATPDRLAFANWMVDRQSPTTARSIVNRIWQGYFGRGLVETVDDLGTQGAMPTHPELLDWLAVELMESGWSLKHIHQLIASSATYQQSSHITPQHLERDPNNYLLARGPRFRVDAEVVRDIALTASGLLNRDIGGPSVYPPAPDFLFKPPASFGRKTWNHDSGDDQYRRALYTFRFRSVPYPALEVFDAPTGNVSCVRRSRSNTPLQALTLLNEPLFVECAKQLAAEMLAADGVTDVARLQIAARRCLCREYDEQEIASLTQFLNSQRAKFAEPGSNAQKLIGKASVAGRDVEAHEHAAWISLARVVLNLDETVTKE